MNKFKHLAYALAFGLFVLFLGACKNKSAETTTTDTAVIVPAPADNTVPKTPDTAIVISADDALRSMIGDATKDFPGVTATVDQGVITITGTISRAKLPNLMKSLNALHPKKITNNLTIK